MNIQLHVDMMMSSLQLVNKLSSLIFIDEIKRLCNGGHKSSGGSYGAYFTRAYNYLATAFVQA
jgi:hypothetical protein